MCDFLHYLYVFMRRKNVLNIAILRGCKNRLVSNQKPLFLSLNIHFDVIVTNYKVWLLLDDWLS